MLLKREPNEQNVNNYNASVMLAWQANMDIQYVLDAYAWRCDVCSFIIHNEDREINGCVAEAGQ